MDGAEIVSQALEPAIATDGRNRVRCWNRAAADLLGLAPGERVDGRPLYEVLEATDAFGNRLAQEPIALWKMLVRGEAIKDSEIAVGLATGERQRVRVSVVMVVGPVREEFEVVYLLRPVLRRRRVDEAIERILADPATAAPAALARSNVGASPRPELTRREREVLRLLARGHAVDGIARALGLSVHTVRSHVRNILRKLGVHSQLEAIARARSERLI